jgi:hypothetical protein
MQEGDEYYTPYAYNIYFIESILKSLKEEIRRILLFLINIQFLSDTSQTNYRSCCISFLDTSNCPGECCSRLNISFFFILARMIASVIKISIKKLGELGVNAAQQDDVTNVFLSFEGYEQKVLQKLFDYFVTL